MFYVRAVFTRSLAYPHGRDLPREITRLIAGPCEEPQGRSTGNLTDRGGSDERTRSQRRRAVSQSVRCWDSYPGGRASERTSERTNEGIFSRQPSVSAGVRLLQLPPCWPLLASRQPPTTFRRTTAYLTPGLAWTECRLSAPATA